MNSCTFVGRIVADAEMKTTQSGTELCKVRIASDCGWGEHKKTHWLDGTLFGNRGAALVQYLTKGTHVTVVGELEPPQTYDAQGETRVAQSIVIREIALQGKGQGESSAQNGQGGGSAPKADGSQGGGGFEDEFVAALVSRFQEKAMFCTHGSENA